jgi:predicted HAD superfamily Cof-like phosphohydrolase
MQSFISQQAKAFRTAFRVSNSREAEARIMQRILIVEEYRELLDAELNVLCKRAGESDVLKELADLVYVCFQYAENMGWDLDEALDRVHKSNMSKLDADGNPIYREDGKVLKGPNYKPPYLEDLVK